MENLGICRGPVRCPVSRITMQTTSAEEDMSFHSGAATSRSNGTQTIETTEFADDECGMPVIRLSPFGPEYLLRPTRPEETDVLVEMAADTGVFKPIEIETLRHVLDDYHGPKPEAGHAAVTVLLDGIPVGFAYFGPNEITDRTWMLYWIFVQRSLHARGLGTKILDYVEAEIRAEGGRVLVIETSGLPNYLPTRNFYLKLGYDQVAVVPDFYADDDDMVVFWKRLTPKP